jgi:[glutamine synthetase] adenylyltransferase / [glutamine synthetase]-adenylyl-L-tyrosine phosphorylase
LPGCPQACSSFPLFEANPQLVNLIVDICSTAPALARYLSRNAGVFDAVIGGSFFSAWPGPSALTAELPALLAAEPDYEKKLDAARRWTKEWHFRIGVHHLRGLIDATEAGTSYCDLASAVVRALWSEVAAQFALRYGPMPGRGAVVMGMGSLGAGRLNAGSDLDLIVIYDAPGDATSTGPRPLGSRAYYARLTQALVTALTAPMAEGRLYEVDMRLRPSGRQGPVATSFDAFRAYQQDEAWTWEHLALTRARCLAGEPELASAFEAFRRALLAEKGRHPRVLPDAAAMRARLLAARQGAPAWEAKSGPGRLMDIEFLAQTAALLAGDPQRRAEAQLRAGVRSGFLTEADLGPLLTALRLCWQLQAAGRLLTEKALDPDALGEGGQAFLLRETGADTAQALTDRLSSVSAAAAAVIGAKLTEVDQNRGDARC